MGAELAGDFAGAAVEWNGVEVGCGGRGGEEKEEDEAGEAEAEEEADDAARGVDEEP